MKERTTFISFFYFSTAFPSDFSSNFGEFLGNEEIAENFDKYQEMTHENNRPYRNRYIKTKTYHVCFSSYCLDCALVGWPPKVNFNMKLLFVSTNYHGKRLYLK